MKKIIIQTLLTIFLILNGNVYAESSDEEYLQKLVSNGYVDFAIDYAKKFKDKKNIKIFLYQTLIDKERFKELLSLKQDSTKTEDLKYRCMAYMFLNDFVNADSLLEKIKTMDSSLYSQLYTLERGLIFYEKYDFKKALQFLSAIKTKPVPLKKILARIYILTNQVEKARKYSTGDTFINAQIEYKSGNCQKALSMIIGNNSEQAEILRYNCLIKLGKYKEAEKALNNLKSYEQNNFIENIQTLIDYRKYDEAKSALFNYKDCYVKFFYIGKILCLEKNYADAAEYFIKALTFDKNSELLYNLASAYKKAGSYYNASKYYNEIINRADSANIYSESLFNLAFCNYKAGNFKDAEKYFKKYLNNEENNMKHLTDCMFMLSESLEKQGKTLDAIKFYNKYREILTDKNKIREIDLKMADLWEMLGNYQFEAEILKKYYPIKEKRNLFILKKLGNIYQKTGHFKESNIFYKEYMDKTDKNFSEIYIKIGMNYLYMNKLDLARKNFLTVIEEGKNTNYREEALFWTGKIYLNLKNYRLAALYFKRLYNSDKFSPLSRKALKYICLTAYLTGDGDTLKFYLKKIKSPFEFAKQFKISIEKLCKITDCSEELTIKHDFEKKYAYFQELYTLLEKKDKDKLRKMLNSNRFHGTDKIVYYYIGKIFYSKDLENEAILAFNKFLNSNYNPVFKYEYREAFSIVAKYYFTKNDYAKIVAFSPVYSKINLEKNLLFIIGYVEHKFNLSIQSKHHLTEFVKQSSNGKKIFKASLYLDKMGFLDAAKTGYLKAEKLLKDKNIKMELYYWLGKIYCKKGNIEKGLNCFLKIKLMFPFDIKWTPTAAFEIAKIFEQTGKYKKALREYNYIYKKLKGNDPRKVFVKNNIENIRNKLQKSK